MEHGEYTSLLLGLIYGGLPLALLILALFSGLFTGRRWDRDLDARQVSLRHLVVTTERSLPAGPPVELLGTCLGCCVGSIDHFRRLRGRLRSLVGGELRPWSVILARCRREATVRMLEEARRLGASHVLCVRFETSTLAAVEERGGVSAVEFLAYGTAVRRR